MERGSFFGSGEETAIIPGDELHGSLLDRETELQCVLFHKLGELAPGCRDEPWIVLDDVGIQQFATGQQALDEQSPEVRAGRVQAGREASRAPTNDDDVPEILIHSL